MKPLSLTRSAVHAVPASSFWGEDVIDLSSDYSQYSVPKPVADAVVHSAQTTDLGRHTAAGGRHLVQVIVEKLRDANDLEVSDESIVVTGGGTSALCLTFGALADAGEQILVPDPGWPGYSRLCGSWGIRTEAYPLRFDGTPDYEVLETLVEHNTKALVINNPGNPLGTILGDRELQELADFARAHELYIVSDETCDLIRYQPGKAVGPARYDTDGRVVTVYSFAKTHALYGLRLGYCVAAPPLAAAVRAAQDSQLAGPSTLALAAGLAALDMDHTVVDSMLAFYHQQRNTALAMLPSELVPRPPAGGFHLLLEFSRDGPVEAESFVAACRDRHQLLLSPGSRYGLRTAHAARITLAVRERPFLTGIERLLVCLDECLR